MSDKMLFEEMQNEWNLLVNQVESLQAHFNALEARLSHLETPAPAPSPAPGVYGPGAQTPASFNPAPVVPTQETAPVVPQPGPQAVPTLDQIRDRLMQLNEAQGPEICMSVLAAHQGKDDAGNINVKLVPAEQYAGLYGVLGARLGLH